MKQKQPNKTEYDTVVFNSTSTDVVFHRFDEKVVMVIDAGTDKNAAAIIESTLLPYNTEIQLDEQDTKKVIVSKPFLPNTDNNEPLRSFFTDEIANLARSSRSNLLIDPKHGTTVFEGEQIDIIFREYHDKSEMVIDARNADNATVIANTLRSNGIKNVRNNPDGQGLLDPEKVIISANISISDKVTPPFQTFFIDTIKILENNGIVTKGDIVKDILSFNERDALWTYGNKICKNIESYHNQKTQNIGKS